MIDGPRIAPASGGRAKSLVVFLHGYGADGNDLIELGRQFAPILPETAFVSPHAPEPCAGAPYGRQWFPLAAIEPHRLYAGVSHAAPELDRFLDAELGRQGLTEADLALVGFSQGTMMALHLAARRASPIAGVVGYSGLLAGPERLAGELKSKPPVLLVHGDADTVIPAMALNAAVRSLSGAGFAVEWHIRPGLQHGIDMDALEMGAAFLARVLG
jgi:phospholipase/carboxylesterase